MNFGQNDVIRIIFKKNSLKFMQMNYPRWSYVVTKNSKNMILTTFKNL